MATETVYADTAYRPPHTFGLPMGSVRAAMAVLILSYFWLVVAWPASVGSIRPLIGHFFLLPLVLYSFTLGTHGQGREPFKLLPLLLRIVVVLGTVGTLAYVFLHGGETFKDRLTPKADEFQKWWLPFAGTLAVGFLVGHTARALLGERNSFYLTLRAWASVIGLTMLTIELGLFIIMLSMREANPEFLNFLHYYEFVEIGIVSAYFGTRV